VLCFPEWRGFFDLRAIRIERSIELVKEFAHFRDPLVSPAHGLTKLGGRLGRPAMIHCLGRGRGELSVENYPPSSALMNSFPILEYEV